MEALGCILALCGLAMMTLVGGLVVCFRQGQIKKQTKKLEVNIQNLRELVVGRFDVVKKAFVTLNEDSVSDLKVHNSEYEKIEESLGGISSGLTALAQVTVENLAIVKNDQNSNKASLLSYLERNREILESLSDTLQADVIRVLEEKIKRAVILEKTEYIQKEPEKGNLPRPNRG